MSRTRNQQMADSHERDMAEWIGGVQHKGSGNQWSRQMDGANGERLVPFPIAGECKATLGKSLSITREMWKKAVEQTFGKIPTIWLRWYKDESLRETDLDLVVVERRDFVEILEAARNWEDHHELARRIENKRIEIEMHPLLPSLDEVRETMRQPSGCDCCR